MNGRLRNNIYFATTKVFRDEIHRFFSEILVGLTGILSCRNHDNLHTLHPVSSKIIGYTIKFTILTS